MRRLAFAILAVGTGCHFDLVPPEETLRGYTKEELEAGPTDRHMLAAILNDVRRWRQLEQHLDEGISTCSAYKVLEGKQVCSVDETEMPTFELRNDPTDKPNRVEETAIYCSKEGVYYYHYVGGPRKFDLWMGPYRIDRPAKKLDDYK